MACALRYSFGLALACAAWTCFAQTQTTDGDEVVFAGRIKVSKGEINAKGLPNGPTRRLQVGDRVRSNEELSTGDQSSMGVTLQDGTLVALGPKTTLRLDQFAYEPRTDAGSMVLSLLKGSMRFVTGAIGKSNRDSIRITTRTATIGIRGTDFIVEASE